MHDKSLPSLPQSVQPTPEAGAMLCQRRQALAQHCAIVFFAMGVVLPIEIDHTYDVGVRNYRNFTVHCRSILICYKRKHNNITPMFYQSPFLEGEKSICQLYRSVCLIEISEKKSSIGAPQH